jgi:ClpP class serine protease
MVSESARMSTAAEAAFRVQAPNSRPRVVKIIALDAASEDVVRRLAAGSWNQATFFTAATFTRNLDDEVAVADLVVLVATPGGDATVASTIGEACSRRRVMTTALIVGATSASGDALSKTLAQLRPWSLMVVIAEADNYIEDMLTALRA